MFIAINVIYIPYITIKWFVENSQKRKCVVYMILRVINVKIDFKWWLDNYIVGVKNRERDREIEREREIYIQRGY